MLPLVSIVVPVYEAANDIVVALDSIFQQTYIDFEVLIVNDGSRDTPALERAIAPYRRRITYIVQENAGAGAARNRGILASRGAYIAFLDADDRWEPQCLRTQVEYLERHPECHLVYADAILSGDSPLSGRTYMETAPSEGNVTLNALIAQRCNVLTSTVVVRRRSLFEAGLFDPQLRRGQDFELWLRMARQGHRIDYQRMVVAERRVRQSGLSGDTLQELDRALAVLLKTSRTMLLSREESTTLRTRTMWLVDRRELEQAKLDLAAGNFEATRQHLEAVSAGRLKFTALRLALRVAPGVVRRMYLALRPAPTTTPAAIAQTAVR